MIIDLSIVFLIEFEFVPIETKYSHGTIYP